jgi:hypothetical protein
MRKNKLINLCKSFDYRLEQAIAYLNIIRQVTAFDVPGIKPSDSMASLFDTPNELRELEIALKNQKRLTKETVKIGKLLKKQRKD